MNVNYQIREATDKEVPELCVLHRRILEIEGISNLISDEQLKSWYNVDSLKNHIILLVDDKIISHIEIKEKHFLYENVSLKFGELSAVHTHPDYRGQGLGLSLLQFCFKHMKKNNMPLSMVLSGVKHFYQSAAYELYPLSVYATCLQDLREKCNNLVKSSYVLRPYSNSQDVDQMLSLYCKHNLLIPTTGVYSEIYWRNLKSDGNQDLICLVAQKESRTVGFLEAKSKQYYADDLLAANILVDESEWGCVTELLCGLYEQVQDKQYSRIVITINNGWEKCEALRSFLCTEPCFESNLMFRIVDLPLMIEKLLPIWNSRLQKRNNVLNGAIEIECLGKIARIDVNENKLSLNRSEYGLRETYLKHLFRSKSLIETYLPLNQQTLFSLLFRPNGVQNILQQKTINLTQVDAELLKAVFT